MLIQECDLPGVRKERSGKVREVFDAGENLLIVTTDRISAFDCIMPNAIPQKGAVLTQLSAFWFQKLDFIPNHMVTTNFSDFPKVFAPHREALEGRSMLVRKCTPLPVECVVRGYLAGSAWEEYQRTGSACGHDLPSGLNQAGRLPEAIFTPAKKNDTGHDENITWRQCRALVGDELALAVRKASIDLYEHGRAWAAARGVIVADTKFEFGILDGELVLIDECLTPDSSRFWPADKYEPGTNPPSFDKQFLRDYLGSLDWDRTPPAPNLPDAIIQKTSEKYLEALERLAGISPLGLVGSTR